LSASFNLLSLSETWLSNGWRAGLAERFGFKPWPGSLCCVLGQEHLASLHPGVPVNYMLGVALRWTSIPTRGEQLNYYSLHATETDRQVARVFIKLSAFFSSNLKMFHRNTKEIIIGMETGTDDSLCH